MFLIGFEILFRPPGVRVAFLGLARTLSPFYFEPFANHPHVQGQRPDKKLDQGEVPPLLLKIDGIVGLETAFAFLRLFLGLLGHIGTPPPLGTCAS